MSVNRASEVWKEIKPFAIRDMNRMLDNKAGDSGDDLYAIILYDESAQKIKYYSMSAAGLAGALGASESGDIVWVPAGTIDFSNIQSIVSTAGAEKCLLIAPGNPLPENWEDSSFDDSSWMDSILGDESVMAPLTGSQRVTAQTGTLAGQSIMLFRRKFVVHFPIPQIAVKVDNYIDELYLNEAIIFQNGVDGPFTINLNPDASIIGENLIAAKVRNADSGSPNPMFLSYVIEFQQIDYAIPIGVEVVGLGKNTIIDSAIENNGILTNIQVTGTISGSGISRMVSNPTLEIFSNQIKSLIATGTSPFLIASTTVNTNLNADLLDGEHASAFADAAHTHVETDITDLDHDAVKIDGITVDLTGIANGQFIKYDAGTTSLIAGDTDEKSEHDAVKIGGIEVNLLNPQDGDSLIYNSGGAEALFNPAYLTKSGSVDTTNLFDGNKTNQWVSSAAVNWLKFNFPYSAYVSKIVITANAGDWMWADWPDDIYIYGSDTGEFLGEEIEMDHYQPVAEGVYTRTFAEPRTAYRYYRMTFGRVSHGCRINEIEIYTVPATHRIENQALVHDATKIDGITVDLTGISDGDALVYDLANTKIKPGVGAGSGDVVGPASSTDGHLAVFDGVDGKTIKDGGAIPTGASLTVEEADGTPSVAEVIKIKVTNGTLTDDGSGVVSLDFGSAATDGSAIHDNEANEISAITEKTTPAANDLLIIEDSEASYVKKSLKLSNLPSSGGGGGSVSSIYSSKPAANTVPDGTLFLPTDGYALERSDESDWSAWGPIFPVKKPPETGWSWVNQGSASVTHEKNGLFFLAPATGGNNNRLYLRSAYPSTPFTIKIGFLSFMSGVADASVGLCLYDSSTGKFISLKFEAADKLIVQRWNSVTSWNGNYFVWGNQVRHVAYFAIEDDGTNHKFYRSPDGVHWHLLLSQSRTAFLATVTGIGLNLNPSTSSVDTSMNLIHWVQE